MIGKIIILVAVVIFVGLVIFPISSNLYCVGQNSVFLGTVTGYSNQATDEGFGGSQVNLCIVQLEKDHFIQFDDAPDAHITTILSSYDSHYSCPYSVGTKLVIQPQDMSFAKIVMEYNSTMKFTDFDNKFCDSYGDIWSKL